MKRYEEDLIKGIIAAIFGITFLIILAPFVSQQVSNSFVELGVVLLVVAIFISIVSLIKSKRRR